MRLVRYPSRGPCQFGEANVEPYEARNDEGGATLRVMFRRTKSRHIPRLAGRLRVALDGGKS